MSSGSRELHLVVPGLFTPPEGMAVRDIPRLPVLERLLARSRKRDATGQGLDATICALFGIGPESVGHLPTAPYARLAQGGDPDDWYWVHADPVFLRPDQDRVLVFDAAVLALTQEEAETFTALFNSHFGNEGLRLEAPTPTHWYLRVADRREARFSSLSEVTGRTMTPFLPQGEEARYWRRLLNETQMLFHNAEPNQRRTEMGRLPVGGVWFHGMGALSTLPLVRWGHVVASNHLARGLAQHTGMAVTTDIQEVVQSANGRVLVVRDELLRPVLDVDVAAWQQALVQLERDLSQWLRFNRYLSSVPIYLYACDGVCRLFDATARRQFWRRRRPLSRYLPDQR